MKKKLISCILSVSMLYTSIGILPVKAEKMPAEKTNETYNVMLEKSTYTFGSTFNQVKHLIHHHYLKQRLPIRD